ncbi:hypothetical protein HHE02_03840 [Helicobacter heilmannii]|nr:hypothetical protein HHE014_05910 [Helicobacter heilmannii]CRF47099.1 hypothetical protein HHE02_03840 [Helicobacter heilmannii]CRF48961.1 hypothetical protein HHE03_05550 [Helicobacter heilmannii]CRF50579.1 hypothetical protein HHE06_04190 [Helicobacter heilmannii]
MQNPTKPEFLLCSCFIHARSYQKAPLLSFDFREASKAYSFSHGVPIGGSKR